MIGGSSTSSIEARSIMSFGEKKSVKDLRRFGFAFGTAMTILGSLLLWRDRPAWPWVLGLAAGVLLSATLAPKVLRPLEMVLAGLLRVVMTVITYVVLTLAFLFVFTPMGVLMRLMGKDLLDRRFPSDEASYWVPVEVDGPATRPDKPY
jgi:hypothetical protein